MGYYWASLLLFVAALIVVQLDGTKCWLEEEKRGLLDIKHSLIQQINISNASSTMKNHSSFLPSWVFDDPNSDSCGWERVTCDSSSQNVIHLSLHNLTNQHVDIFDPDHYYCSNSVSSFNMSFLLSFKHLTTFNLSHNCFESLIGIQDGRSYSTFTMLETLDLSHNYYFNESIIKPLTAFTSLKNLNLAYCNINGPLPIQAGIFTMLESLDLSYNYLDESITKFLTVFTSLKNLNLAYCGISGRFPVHELSVLQSLEQLYLSGCDIFSPSPTVEDINCLSKLKKLTTLDLSMNHEMDTNIFKYLVALPALTHLYLELSIWSFDGFDGVLKNDSGLCKMTQLQELDLSGIDLIGTLENTCLPNLTSLRALDLSGNNLSGSIPSSLFSPLVSLEFLSLSYNNFEGLFPLSSLANHSKLKVLSLANMQSTKAFQVETENSPWIPSFQLESLDLSHSLLSSPSTSIPTFLLHQHDLKYIDLSYNNLVGVFPNWLLLNNSGLTHLLLDHNSFTGLLLPPPSYLYKPMDQLRVWKLSYNKLNGKLPKNIGYFLPHLEYLDVSRNMLDGDIPDSIGDMSNLMLLDLSHNNFSGKIPKDIFLKCILLVHLDISSNNLHGGIFSTPMNLGSLELFVANNNQLNGTLEGEHLVSLRVLDISRNKFSGMLPSWITDSNMESITVSSNNFEGAIPLDFCKNGNLGVLDLSENRFLGEIPPCIFNSTSLSFIDLRSNSLTGTIPEIVSDSSSLEAIDLSDNKFSGTIPESFYRLEGLQLLLLANNKLKGQLSNQICQLEFINILDLSHNNFIGSIPSCFSNMSFGKYGLKSFSVIPRRKSIQHTYYYYHSHFQLYRDLKFEFRYILDEVELVTKGLTLSYKGVNLQTYLSGLDLSFNQLTGKIPLQLGFLQELYALNLSHNHLSGSIPESLHNLSKIESLDLSYNNLTGEIPPQLQELHYLSVFNVCYNNLSGRAPNQGQFANFDESNYRGNPNLWWTNTNRRTAEPPTLEIPLNDTQGSEFPIDLTAFYWSFGASYVVVLLTLVTILWINPYWRRVWFYFITICIQKSFGRFFEDVFF